MFLGSIIGLAATAATTSVLRAALAFPATDDVLYGVNTFDPGTFVGLSACLAVVALLASVVPAYRALSVAPMIALRHE